MLTTDFAKSIRDKYPDGVTSDGVSYADMSDQDLVNKVVAKYPVYKSQIEDLDKGGAIGSPIDAVKEFGSDVVSAVKERAGNIGETLKQVGEDKPIAENVGDAFKQTADATIRKPLRILGQGAALVGDVELAALKLIAPKFAEDLAAKGMQKISETELAQNVSQKIDEFKTAHPEAAQDIEDVINIAAVIPELKAAQLTLKGGTKAIQTVSKVTDKVIDASRASRIAAAGDEINDVVGTIVQGKTDDILKAKKALSTIDTAGVKTYSDLGTRINDGIEALANKVDDILDAEGKAIGPLKTDQLVRTTQVGEKAITQNFVKDALDQLDEMYAAIKDTPSQAKIIELKNKLNTEGLTVRELNDLSRTYGREFKNKAFSKMGDPLTSVNGQAFENTRKGVKNTLRDLMPNDTVKMLDERMSEMFNTEALVSKMEEKVNALYQKAKPRGVLEKVARGAADVVNAATFNTLSGFVSRLLPSNVGLKVMNSIDLENMLGKNLKKLNKLLKITDDKALQDGIVDFVKNGVDNIKSTSKKKTLKSKVLGDSTNYAYHATNPKNIESISQSGLLSEKGGYGSLYLAPTEEGAIGYGGNKASLLRVNKSKLPTDYVEAYGEKGAGSLGEIKTKGNIPPEFLEIKINGKWKPLSKVSSDSQK